MVFYMYTNTIHAYKGKEHPPLPVRKENLMSESIFDRVKAVTVDHLGVEPEKVVPKAEFINDLGADSLDTVELVMAFEEIFSIEIPDDAAENIVTVQDAVKLISQDAEAA